MTGVTDAMIEAGANAFGACHCDTCYPSASDRAYFGTIYRAMEAARPPVQTDGLVADLRHLLRNAKIEGEGTVITITVNDRAERMNLIGHLANLRDRVV